MNVNACTKAAKKYKGQSGEMDTDLTSALLLELLQHTH